ncbi:MFS transporter [Segatella copri]|uniref:MFS transporter n=1 Tax=Segatella copri TaxID=165179 RepID=UPI001F174C14|nr:MFS transporter [Segatella copri]
MKESTTSGCLNTRNSTLPFFMWGFAHGILEVLNPHFQESFHISKTMSALTQAAVYGAYFLMALPAGWIIRKWGYRRGVITGLVLFGIGALMFIPGSRLPVCISPLAEWGCSLSAGWLVVSS